MALLLTRDKTPHKTQIVESSGNFLDYIFYQNETKRLLSEKFNERKRKALIKLINQEVDNNFTERQKIIFDMKYNKKLKQVRIAEVLKLNPSTVCRTLHRINEKLSLKYDDFMCLKELFVEE